MSSSQSSSVHILINKQAFEHLCSGSDRLLTLLHHQGLVASKLGCGAGHCGACTVWVDEAPRRSCEITLEELGASSGANSGEEPSSITTLEGLAECAPFLADCLTQAFLNEQAAQCGYCTAGILMKAAAFIRDHDKGTPLAMRPSLSESDVAEALDEHLCRCGSQRRVIRAVKAASEAYARRPLVTQEVEPRVTFQFRP